jgi:hypothetical protein
MNLLNVNEALDHVREVTQAVLERQRFRGYSGPSRILSGSIALVAAVVMSSELFPDRNLAHILGWGGVFMIAFFLNAVAVIRWFLHDPVTHRNFRVLKPTLDVLPPIAVGGVLTAVMIWHQQYQYLFGIWMCLFGLTNMASRMVLPRLIWLVGAFYITAGAMCLLAPGIDFRNPWPMGIVFFAGELVGGCVLHMDGTRNVIPVRPREGANADE